MSETENVEDYPLSEVPYDARHGFSSILSVLLGFTFFSATMWAGGTLGVSFKIWPDLVLIIVAGNILLSAYVAILSYIASKSGLNTVLMGRFCFGRLGSKWADLLLSATQVGWYAWGTATIAIVLSSLLGLDDSWQILLMIFFGFAFCQTAYIGYRGLEWLSKISVPLIVILLIFSMWVAISDAGGISGLFKIIPMEAMGVGQAITIVVGTFISGGTQATNWTRFARTEKEAVSASVIAFFIGNGLMLFGGAIGALVYQESDIVNILAIQGLLLFGIVMLFANIWTTQDNTIYNFSVAGCNLLNTNRRRAITLAGAGIGTVIAILGMYEWLIPYMEWLGLLIPPIGGIIMADFFFVRKGAYEKLSEKKDGLYPDFNYAGLMAYIAGCLAALPGFGIPPLNGIITSALVYILLNRLTKIFCKN
ncbi:cytosine permease [Methanoplanus sp. FWC-SCC4]|uniref:Cytosine permease n=1 Tax=Methanochimaera problematica TaxID=2609417 RepID=A0AA97FF85_9EURY|nr:cytosine permease [Methanoplanus sp. FWC-SCC4]WOF17208.1 cytosine permease [Methanoplanus sp. FWC-SCC4]